MTEKELENFPLRETVGVRELEERLHLTICVNLLQRQYLPWVNACVICKEGVGDRKERRWKRGREGGRMNGEKQTGKKVKKEGENEKKRASFRRE